VVVTDGCIAELILNIFFPVLTKGECKYDNITHVDFYKFCGI
jgi:hypothetical protein